MAAPAVGDTGFGNLLVGNLVVRADILATDDAGNQQFADFVIHPNLLAATQDQVAVGQDLADHGGNLELDLFVAVDLLDRAASLLKHLVDQRLKGVDRFDAANRLALVYLLDRKPQEALEALAGQVPGDIIPQWTTTRRHLKARALAELSRYKEGLALIKDDGSLDAETLRAEIFWKVRDWASASATYQRIVKATVKDTTDAAGNSVASALDDDAQRNVLSLAIAYALDRDQASLKTLRLRYLGRMSKGTYKESFDVVTAPSGNIPDDYRIISSKVAEVDQYRSFMKSYREKLLQRGQRAAPRPGPSASAEPAGAQG